MPKLSSPSTTAKMSRWLVAGSVLLLLAVAGYALLVQPEANSPGQPSNEPGTRPTTSTAADSNALPTLQISETSKQLDRLIDPKNDGWVSEAFAEQAKQQLKLLFKRQAKAKAEDFGENGNPAGDLHASLVTAFDDGVLQVKRSDTAFMSDTADASANTSDTASASSLATAKTSATVQAVIAPLVDVGPVDFSFKVVRVDMSHDKPQTTCLYESGSRNDKFAIQQTGQLECIWSDGTPDAKLESLTIRDFEEVRMQNSEWFLDCTESVLGDEPAYRRQLGYGTNYWMQRIERAHGMDDSVRTGLAIGDANGDGLEDVYVCQGPGLPNLLLVQNANGTVRNIAREAGVDWLDQTSSALFLDLDNDGDQDLAIATTGGLVIMANVGNERFEMRASLAEQMIDVQSLSAADYDLDGDTDLFLCAYRHASGRQQGEFVFHDATSGGRNYLFRNDVIEPSAKAWPFVDVTDEVGLGAGATRYTLAGTWEDYDNDGDSDLYVANDYGRNFLFQNTDGRFVDITAEAGLMDTGFGMSVDWGDHDRDGLMDLYIGNMFSSAGSRITQQSGFQTHSAAEQRSLYRRMAQGNSLFRNDAASKFLDISADANVQMGRWAWSSVFADLNNDGWEDLVVANGYISTDDTGDL